MSKKIKQEVLECDICHRCKNEHVAYPRLLKPLSEPQYGWIHISMDFIEGLPTSGAKNVILVVVDRFTKYAHFITLAHSFSSSSIARLFLDHIYR